MIIFLSLILLGTISGLIFINQKKFGKLASGERLERIKKSPNYNNDAFHNQTFTPTFADGTSYWEVMKMFFFGKFERTTPIDKIPSIKTNLKNISHDEDIIVWFGHSSYFMQIEGKKYLIDPVFSGAASPIPFSIQAFPGSNVYSADDIPELDYLIITHDHWDHLDYETIMKLKSKVKSIICPLGVGEHFEYWGFDTKKITEEDWGAEVKLDLEVKINYTTARHFGGRLWRNKTLWTSYVLQTSKYKIFIGGDGGYDKHFKEIGDKFGPFDIAMLESGQYNKFWRNIHLMPNEIINSAIDLITKRLFTVHNSKFKLAQHPWDEPLNSIIENNKSVNMNIVTPKIGEKVNLQDSNQQFEYWWKNVK